jgi:hypothetical protein
MVATATPAKKKDAANKKDAKKDAKAGATTTTNNQAGNDEGRQGNVTMKTVARIFRRLQTKIADAAEMAERDTRMKLLDIKYERIEGAKGKVDFKITPIFDYEGYIATVPLKNLEENEPAATGDAK